jgi:ubiquitin carboxyl-terminal hydrolase 7
LCASLADEVLQTVLEDDIPEQLIERLQEEKRQEALRRKERNEAHLFMNIHVFTEDSFMGHKGSDLYDTEKAVYKVFKVRKQSTLKEAVELIAEQMKYPMSAMRVWPIISRANETMRPSSLDFDGECNRQITDVCEGQNPWNMFLELIEPDADVQTLPAIDKESQS